MLVRNESNGQMIDTDANERGEARYDFATAWDVAHMIEPHMVRAQYYKNSNDTLRERVRTAQLAVMDVRNSSHLFITWLGDTASQYSIDNDLCANYERFLTGALGEYVADEQNNDDARELARTFVRHASRIREYEVKASRTSRVVGRNVDEWTAQREAAQATDPYEFRVNTDDVVAVVLSDYDEVQARNESYARRGNYNIIAPREDNDGDVLPRSPINGQRARDLNGVLREWCNGCGEWHEAYEA